MKRINVFVGNYGSGKTEISINVALRFVRQGKRTMLVDADTVNPFFRSSAHRAALEREGIRVVSPVYANTAVDLPTVPPDIHAAFDSGDTVVIDCGGDPGGASVLGSLHDGFLNAADQTAVYYVVNTCRPMQREKDQIITMYKETMLAARLSCTGIVYNTNLAEETTADDLIFGYPVIRSVSGELNVPIAYV